VMIVMMVLPVLLELRLSGIFNLNSRFSGQRLLSLVFACFFYLFLTFLLGLCISFLATARYRRWVHCVSPFVWSLCLKALITWPPGCFICSFFLFSFGLAPLFGLQHGIDDGFLFVLRSTYRGFCRLASLRGSVFTCFISLVLLFSAWVSISFRSAACYRWWVLSFVFGSGSHRALDLEFTRSVSA